VIKQKKIGFPGESRSLRYLVPGGLLTLAASPPRHLAASPSVGFQPPASQQAKLLRGSLNGRALNRSLHGTLFDGDDLATVAAAVAAIAAVTAVATIAPVAAVAAVAAIATVATVTAMAAAVASILHGAAVVSVAAAVPAAVASATVRAAIAVAAGKQASFGIPLTTHQGDSNQGEEDRHTEHNDAIHSQILQCASRYQKVKPLTSPSTVPHPTADGPAEWMQSQVHLARHFPAGRQAPVEGFAGCKGCINREG
jgi:hypothetical protein